MIKKAWKVVDKETRSGSNGWIFRNGKKMTPKEFLDYRKSLQLPGIIPLYLKGKKVKAYKGTVGLMCFRTIMDAKRFINCYFDDDGNSAEIIRVEGEIKEHDDNIYIFSGGGGIKSLMHNIIYERRGNMRPPNGTIFMKWVRVLE